MENICKVLLLPTGKEPVKGDLLLRHIWIGEPIECKSLWQFNETVEIGGVRQYTVLNSSFRDAWSKEKPLYMYILSDDAIQDGDWIYHNLDKKPIHFTNDNKFSFTTGEQAFDYGYRKIIATNDPTLTKPCNCSILCTGRCEKPIPSLSPEFLKDWCKDYNKDTIDEVLVDYEVTDNPKLTSEGQIIATPISDKWQRVRASFVYDKDGYNTMQEAINDVFDQLEQKYNAPTELKKINHAS